MNQTLTLPMMPGLVFLLLGLQRRFYAGNKGKLTMCMLVGGAIAVAIGVYGFNASPYY